MIAFRSLHGGRDNVSPIGLQLRGRFGGAPLCLYVHVGTGIRLCVCHIVLHPGRMRLFVGGCRGRQGGS